MSRLLRAFGGKLGREHRKCQTSWKECARRGAETYEDARKMHWTRRMSRYSSGRAWRQVTSRIAFASWGVPRFKGPRLSLWNFLFQRPVFKTDLDASDFLPAKRDSGKKDLISVLHGSRRSPCISERFPR